MTTKISWTDETWNPTVGCARVSPGCVNCYAEHAAAMVNRTQGEASVYRDLIALTGGTRRDPKWNGKAKFLADRLSIPLGWRKPRRVFVDSMSDWLHPDITNEQVGALLAIAAMTPHTYQFLTKRAARLPAWFKWFASPADGSPLHGYDIGHRLSICLEDAAPGIFDEEFHVALCNIVNGVSSLPWQGEPPMAPRWPLPNVWLGVSVENQAAADERVPLLLKVRATVRFLSCEPLIGPVDLTAHCPPFYAPHLRRDRIGWVIAGCESGPGARPCEVDWLRSLRDQCKATSVPFFLKQAAAGVQTTGDGAFESTGIVVAAGPGSHRKGGGVIELPYLDGVQHAAFPDAPNA